MFKVNQHTQGKLHPFFRGKPNTVRSELLHFISTSEQFIESSESAIDKGSILISKMVKSMAASLAIARKAVDDGFLDESALSSSHINDLLVSRTYASLKIRVNAKQHRIRISA